MTDRAVPSKHLAMEPARLHLQLLAVVVLSVICCATALAATSPIIACDRMADLQNLEIPVYDLSAVVVGHAVADPDDQDDSGLEAGPAEGRSEVPILDLAPRVAVILQDIFSAVAVESPPLESPEGPLMISSAAKRELPLTPVAGDASEAEPLEPASPMTEVGNADAAPSIQRQMFRTDI